MLASQARLWCSFEWLSVSGKVLEGPGPAVQLVVRGARTLTHRRLRPLPQPHLGRTVVSHRACLLLVLGAFHVWHLASDLVHACHPADSSFLVPTLCLVQMSRPLQHPHYPRQSLFPPVLGLFASPGPPGIQSQFLSECGELVNLFRFHFLCS